MTRLNSRCCVGAHKRVEWMSNCSSTGSTPCSRRGQEQNWVCVPCLWLIQLSGQWLHKGEARSVPHWPSDHPKWHDITSAATRRLKKAVKDRIHGAKNDRLLGTSLTPTKLTKGQNWQTWWNGFQELARNSDRRWRHILSRSVACRMQSMAVRTTVCGWSRVMSSIPQTWTQTCKAGHLCFNHTQFCVSDKMSFSRYAVSRLVHLHSRIGFKLFLEFSKCKLICALLVGQALEPCKYGKWNIRSDSFTL